MAANDEIPIEVKYEVEEDNLEDPLEVPAPTNATNATNATHATNATNATKATNDNYGKPQQYVNIASANNINGKINIALNVLRACKEQANLGHEISGLIADKLEYFTKLPSYDRIMGKVLKEKYEDRSFKQALVETQPLPLTVPFINSDIRDIFIEHYVKRKQIPTLTDFMTSLHSKRDDMFYKNATIRTLVKNKLVDYHHLPTLHRYIINENPEHAYKRHLYLREIIGYRSRRNSIVYVTVLKVLTDKYLVLAFSSTAGLMAKSDCLCGASDSDEDGNNHVRLWIQSELLPVLSPSAVVVLMQPRKEINTPSVSSRKETLIKWLLERDIPCDTDSHTSQLYNLFKLHRKKNKEQGFYENIFASNGIKVVVCRIEYPKLIYLHDICSNISNTASNVSFNITQMLKGLSQKEWVMMEQEVIREERQMMEDDEEMGTIVDNLLEMVKNGDIKAEDFPDGCFGTKVDNFNVHIGDILID